MASSKLRIHAIVSVSFSGVVKMLLGTILFLLPSPADIDGIVDSGALAEFKREDLFEAESVMVVYLSVLKLSEAKWSTRNYFTSISSDQH